MAAEHEVFDVVTTGSESDLELVTRIARSMRHTDPALRITIVCAPGDRNQVLELGLV